ncbi:magnesium transporter [bacterium]|jgi:magnesium transporter|nr:magnesium transporter [bacterium]MDA9712264.1 magnesium transporter [Acidimicrobiaceae bacterium]|tara:strand:- start:1473 stop:2843 length:1371 start_codon:yes stop_codon:yes gene_type:complete
MNNDSKEPLKGKELRDLARSEPGQALIYLENNKDLWVQIAETDPFDSADTLEEFDPSEAGKLITSLPIETSVKIFESLRPRAIIEIVEILKDSYVEEIFKQMDTEDVVDVFERSTEDETEEILEILDKSTKLNINKRLAYPENSVGRQMSEEVAKISTGLKVKDALKELKALHDNVEDLIYVYSVDNEGKLTGVISFREIVFADENELIKNVMIQNPISVNPSSDQEEAAILIKQYELLALPVVDKSNKLIGQTTVNTALDVIQTEIAEDFSQSFGAGAEETIFTPIQKSIRLRLPWIAINMGLAFIVSLLISQFEETIASDILLAALMPVVALVGGNSGAQSLAIVIRALARNDVSDARVFEVIGKQTFIGIINGIFVGVLSFLILSFIGLNDYSLALSIAVFGNIFIGNLFGSSIPLMLKKIGFDPALASNIFLTLITDIAGFAGFLGIALLLL